MLEAIRRPLVRADGGAEVEAALWDDLGLAWVLALRESRVAGVGVEECEGGCCECEGVGAAWGGRGW